ncbi:hypothetical protein WR25_23880 [Diploscapter pachys]|uniref:Carboxylesterase type B domain-containing protein n=1 Tax=Diploscapter pachys TaxID=2018661 RepID=A0A2A2JLC7_9BILA|nr:hypothetical protein WR25_23880 [Diploscapter pachys]
MVAHRSRAQVRTIGPFELNINSGAIRGERLLINGEDYAVFKGIPYAMPPVGSMRAMCVQKIDESLKEPERYITHISEDCLYLNIFAPTPYQYTNDTHPVIVFIHGGDFQTGAGSDLPQTAILDNFVSRKIVFVTINYRLGPIGFLSGGDDDLPGNLGLWDQIWALKWVKANAEVFGGDPNNISLMGHGSGAASASILALSPRAEGLFNKVILMSGSALQPGAVRETAYNATLELAVKMGCRAINSTQIKECLRRRTRDEMLDYRRIHYDDYMEFVPIVDGAGGVIPEIPEDLAKHRKKVPMMIGTTKDESSLSILILNEKSVNFSDLSTEVAEKLADNLTLSYTQFQNHRLISQGCKAEYVWPNIDPSLPDGVLFNSVLKMFSHFWHDAPASRLATYYARKAPVFLYSFDHISENFYDHARAFHGVDKLHLFNVVPKFLRTRKDMNWQLDKRVVEIFSDLIVNFAKTGHPTPDGSNFNFNWTTMNEKELNYLSITDNPTMEVGYRWDGHVFWNWYARSLDAVDVGNLQRITQLDKDIGNWQVNEIIRSSARSISTRLNEIKSIAVEIVKSKIFTGRPPTDDEIWNTQENKFRQLIERNDQFVKRLLSNDVTEEVKQLDEKIQDLYSKLEMYRNGNVYVVKTLEAVLRKAPDSAFNKWEEIRNEIYGGHSNYATSFYNRNSMVMPDKIDFVNKELEIMYSDDKSTNERIRLVKENHFAMLQAESGGKSFTDDELENSWKIQASPELYDVTSKEEAIEMLKKTMEEYSDEELAEWETTFEGRIRSNFEKSG